MRRIPPGYVRTYGDVSPGAPRYAGTALRHAGDDVPWWRVVRSDGTLAQGAKQAARLREDGVLVRGNRVDLKALRLDDLDVL